MNAPTTFEELLEYPDRIERMTDDELIALLRPHFPFTRPANAPSASDARLKKVESSAPSDAELIERARAIKARKLTATTQQTP